MKNKCLNEEMLADYLEGRLSDRKRKKVEQHLSQCDQCLDCLVIAEKMTGQEKLSFADQPELDTVPEEVTRRAIERIKGLQSDSIFDKARSVVKSHHLAHWLKKCSENISNWLIVQSPLPSPVRGDKTPDGQNPSLIKKSFGGIEIEIEFELIDQDRSVIKVRLIKGAGSAKSLRVTLQRDGRTISSFLIIESGQKFENIPSGDYVLLFTCAGEKVGEYPFQLKKIMCG